MISVIIRTFNEERYLPELLQGIQRQSVGQPVEVLVVDSGSTDQTRSIASEYGCQIVEIKKSEFTFGRSLNLGCAAAQGEILVFISGHCVPFDDHWLMALTRPFQDSTVGVAYGRQVGGPDTRFTEHQIFAKYFPDHAQPSQVGFFCNNANSAVRRSLWKRFGYDESLTGLEDMHFGKRTVAAGFSVQYAHQAAVYHFHHESWGQIQRRFEREAMALQDIMPAVQLGLIDAFRYTIAGICSDFGVALGQKGLWRELISIVRYRICQYRGAWKGHHRHRKLSARERERYFYPR